MCSCFSRRDRQNKRHRSPDGAVDVSLRSGLRIEGAISKLFGAVYLLLVISVPLFASPAVVETGASAAQDLILAHDFSQVPPDPQSVKPDYDSAREDAKPATPAGKKLNSSVYNGTLRVYVVEPVSRYADSYGVPFDFGLLDFAYNQSISLGYTDTIRQTVIWNSASFGVIQQDNIMVLAAVSNGEGHTAYSSPGPPPSYLFTANWIDAAAAAIPGQTGTDTASGSFTHNVLIEWAASSG